jgi:UDP-N-acetylmuramoyl-L-alanyl-D-glutamate--2,6-diaminopimelate ligase
VLALAMLVEAGHDPAAAAAALAAAGPVPGRMERVRVSGTPGQPVVVVDYAHSPDAVAAALDALRDAGHPLVVVLGAGGDRDRDKRPLMGAAAARAADVVVVTDDNPRSEDPAQIRAAVLRGARAAARERGPGTAGAVEVVEVERRRAAIGEAVRRAWGGGVVLVAGKGHEQGQDVAGVVHPFDDRAVAREVLREQARSNRPEGTRA